MPFNKPAVFRRAALLIAIALVCFDCAAQEQAQKQDQKQDQDQDKHLDANLNLHQWGAVTLFHGLPSDHVHAIAQDVDGSLWFGTDGGLAKHDGRRTQKVVADGLPPGRVLALKLDSEGVLWIGTDSGAARLVHGAFVPVAETAGHPINSILIISKGQVALAGDFGEILICSGADQLTTRRIGPDASNLLRADEAGGAPLPLTSLTTANDGTLLIGTLGRGLLAVAGEKVQEINSRPRPFFLNCAERDASGRVWVGAGGKTDNGIYYSGDLARFERVSGIDSPVNSIQFEGPNAWIGTSSRGLFHLLLGETGQQGRFRGEIAPRIVEHFTFDNTAGGLRSNVIYSVFADREGVIWIGTDRGVCRYDPRSPRVEKMSDYAASNYIHAVMRTADGRLWCGTSAGLFVRVNETESWREVSRFAGRIVHCLFEDSPSRLLVGTANGLYSIDLRRGGLEDVRQLPRSRASTNPDSVRAIRRFQGAIYAAVFGGGLERISAENRSFVWPAESMKERDLVSLYAESDTKLWIGTAQSGVFVYDGAQVTSENVGAGLGAVWSISGSRDSIVWLATSTGLYSWMKGGSPNPAIPDTDARCVAGVDSHNAVWCGTAGAGLFRVVIDSNGSTIVAKLDTEHGFPSNSIFSLRADAGDRLWIGTNRGLACYSPTAIAPLMKVTRAVGNRAYTPEEVQQGLRLDYPQNSLSIDVAAISSRTFPEQFLYAFQLLDNHGRVLAQRQSSDSQFITDALKPGSYTIEARAFSSDLVASDTLAINFVVPRAPLPRATIGLSILLAVSLTVLWWSWRQYIRLGRTNRQLAETRLQLATETERERRRIARDLHDQTLADLRRLMLTSDQLPLEERSQATALRSEIESISTEIRRICEDLSPSVLANVGLIAAFEWVLVDSVSHLPPDHRPEYKLECPDDLEEQAALTTIDKIQIYRIVQEAVSNICRHANARHILIAASADATSLEIVVEDDGKGFDPHGRDSDPEKSPIPTGRGVSNIRSRASLINARVTWSARPDGGTRFTLSKNRE